MAVIDLWHGRGERARCRDCGTSAGPPTSRHGRGKRWRVKVRDQPTRSFSAKADAIEWERELWATPTPAASPWVADLVALWLAGKGHLSPGGLREVQQAASRTLARWGDARAADVTRADAQAWVSGLMVQPKGQAARPASHTVRAKAAQCLAGALRIAVEQGTLASNPADGLVIGRAERRVPRFLAPAEVQRLADASEWPASIWLLATGGFRISEALALTIGDVSMERRRVRVQRSKTGRGRDVPLPAFVLGMLDVAGESSAKLLRHPRGLKMDKYTYRQAVLLPAAKGAQLDGLTTHDLRHTAASLAIASGADVKVVQAMLGHASAAMTLDLYGHLFSSGLDDVARRMGSMFERDLPDDYRSASD